MNGIRFQIAEVNETLFDSASELPLGRLQARGAGALTTTELLSLLITPATGRRSKKDNPAAALEAAAAVLAMPGLP
jgi:DNA repair protein RadC